MQQRRLRPGDVLDDYCPRERRVTDHAIVAMIDDTIQRTRCVSCDAEHEYKGARVPPQRKKKGATGLFNQVLEGLQPPSARLPHAPPPSHTPPQDAASDIDIEAEEIVAPAAPVGPDAAAPLAAAALVVDEVEPDAPDTPDAMEPEPPGEEPRVDEGPIRRRLFRATLPKHEGQQVPARAVPEFTIRQPGSGRGAGRPAGGRGFSRFGSRQGGRPEGGGHGGGHGRGQGGRPGGHGQGGHGQGQGRPGGGRRRGGKKR